MSNGAHDPWTRWFAGIAATLLAFLFAMVIVATIRGPSVNDRLDTIEKQVAFIACIVLVPDGERNELAVAQCQPQ